MGDTKAEEDDEEGFGDFTFAPPSSSFPNSTPHSDLQIRGRKFTSDNNDKDDDWGDFVESPLRSASPAPSKPFDPFGFFPDQSTAPPSQLTAAPTESPPSRAESLWVKPRGALPLSIFGDVGQEEEEERSSVLDPPAGDAKDSAGDKQAGNGRNGSNLFVSLEVNEVIANLYNQREQIKAENGLNSDSNGSDSNVTNSDKPDLSGLKEISELFSGNNGFQSPQITTVSGFSSDSNLFSGTSDIQSQQTKASSGLNLNAGLFSGNMDFDPFTNLYSENQQHESSNGLNSNISLSTATFMGMDSYSGPPGGNEEFDGGDDDGWEFKDAFSESNVGDGNDKVDGKEQENLELPGFSFEFANGSHGSIDLFSASNGFSGKPGEVDTGFDFKPPTVDRNGINSDSFFKSEQNGTANGFSFNPVLVTVESNESFGDFEGAFTGTELKQGNETVSKNHKGALPLSIFGDEEPETDDSQNVQDAFTFKTSLQPRNGINSQGSNVSVVDLISNLYGQAEQIPSVDNTKKLTGNGFDSSDKVVDPSLRNSDDDLEDDSWDFKDASTQTRAVNQSSLHSHGDTHHNLMTNSKMNNYVDFYCKLKDELFFVCRSHLDNLKKAKVTAALSDEDANVAAIEEEIEKAWKELRKENIYSKDFLEDKPQRDVSLNEFLDVLHEMKFQVLESEYHLSRRLHLAEMDLGSAIELMKHTTLMLNVLLLGSMEDQCSYVSTWSKMISVCAQELKHGSQIWKQLVEKNIKSWILSEPRGKHFIIALGEIYRVVIVLGASAKLYKPWILSSSADSTSIYAVLEECYTLWSSSGLDEALQGISDTIDVEYHSTVEALRESIKFIYGLDELMLGNQVFNQQVSSICRLSLLTSEAVPEMKMVFWSRECYFLTVANFWANLISSDPPELPHLDVGS